MGAILWIVGLVGAALLCYLFTVLLRGDK